MTAATATRTATAQKIADLLADGQARTPREIADASGAGFSTVGKTLNAMAQAGEAVRTDGRWTLVTTTDADAEAAEWLDARHAEAQPVEDAPAEVVEDAPADQPMVKLMGISDFNVHAAQATGLVVDHGQTWVTMRGTVAEIMAAAEATLANISDRGSRQAMHTVIRKLRNADPRYMRVLDGAPAPAPVVDDAQAAYAALSPAQRALLAKIDQAPDRMSFKVAKPTRRVLTDAGLIETGLAAGDPGNLTELGQRVAAIASAADGAPVAQPRATVLPAKGRGDLRADVLAWLQANPGVEITPAKLGRIMGGRSSGAILKGLDRLVRDGLAVQTSAAPRAYRLA